jgi:hypothetical protein
MDEQQTNTLRRALHGWIDYASAEHLNRINRTVQSILAGDTVGWPSEELPHDRLAPEAQIKAIMAREQMKEQDISRH